MCFIQQLTGRDLAPDCAASVRPLNSTPAYAKREGNVEISLSFPQFDVDGDDVDSNDDLRILKLSPFLRQFTHLEILTLAAGRHDERNFARLMGSLGNLCRLHLRKLRTLNLFIELEGCCWGFGNFEFEDIYLPGDEFNSDDEFLSDEENDTGKDSSPVVLANTYTPFEERTTEWKKIEDKYGLLVESIMTSFFKKASSVREVCWHFREPVEDATSSCWVWRRIQQKGAKLKEDTMVCPSAVKWSRSNRLKVKLESTGIVIGDMMIQGTFRDPPIFTYGVGREADYKRAFSHEEDGFYKNQWRR